MAIGPIVVRDLELALLRVLADGQLLGAAIDEPLAGAGEPPGRVRIILPEDVARGAVTSEGLVLRDEESTPLARLGDIELGEVGLSGVELSGVEPSGVELSGVEVASVELASADERSSRHAIPGSTVVLGTITPLRAREGGEARAFALAASDLRPAGAGPAVVVLGRPPVTADTAHIRSALEQTSGRVLVVVPDSPGADIPTTVMLAVAQLWIDDLGLDIRAEVRVAPLAWRDPASDARLVDLLGHALGASHVLHLRAGDGGAGMQWAGTRAALERGDGTGLDALSPAIAARLSRWRPPRARRGLVLMFTGLSGSGKSTVARDLGDWIRAHSERTVTLLDGDVVRTLLSSGLGFDRPSRELNVRRIGYVATEIARHGGIAICAPIAPYAATRAAVRELAEQVGDFVLVHVSTPLHECERRDLKGLYAKARAGLIPEFTGVSDPYEEPVDADLTIDTSVVSRSAALSAVLLHLRGNGWLPEIEPGGAA